jgi:cell division protein FtsB
LQIYSRISALLYGMRRRLATAGVALIALWLAFHVVFGANGMLVYTHKRAEYKTLDRDIKSLQDENARLEQHIKALKSDPKTIEKEAREQLRYARPGEVVYALPEQKPVAKAPQAAAKK